uniref:hypothetical protein n=1 Tax=Xanthomonas albilineans TaxID=29447 RepID=UPI0027DD9A69|nr:hypothetical protein [Xanthomonas albilineans]
MTVPLELIGAKTLAQHVAEQPALASASASADAVNRDRRRGSMPLPATTAHASSFKIIFAYPTTAFQLLLYGVFIHFPCVCANGNYRSIALLAMNYRNVYFLHNKDIRPLMKHHSEKLEPEIFQ